MEGGLRCTLDYIPKYYFVFCLYNQQISCINTTNNKIPVEKTSKLEVDPLVNVKKKKM